MPRQKSTHVDDPSAVGQRLKQARESTGLSQRQLAFPGCSPAYISRIESGDRIPSLQLLRELGRRLGVSEDYLATGHELRPARDELLEAEVALRLDDLELAERLFRDALAAGEDEAFRARVLAGLGELAFRKGDPRGAIDRLEEAIALDGSLEREPSPAETLGRAYATVGELESAIAIFERCLDRAERAQEAFEIVRFGVLLAYAFMDTGNLGRAEELLGRALAIGRDSTNPTIRMQLYWSQSKLHGERNDLDTAADYARRALEVLRITEDTHRTARAYQLLAHIEIDRGRAEEALELLREGWPILERTGNPLERAHFRIEEARALAKLGRAEEAGALAMELTGQLGEALPEDAGRAYSLLGDIFADLGDGARAQELYELAIELLERRNGTRYVVEVYTKLADLLEEQGQKEAAFDLMKKALGAQRALADAGRS
ncbi:MAG: tetratricopeptide repeat protein [Gaiellaceae bacterium]